LLSVCIIFASNSEDKRHLGKHSSKLDDLLSVCIIFATIKKEIIQTLSFVSSELNEIASESFIIGASAMILSDIEIGNTSDIDILTTVEGSDKLQTSLRRFMKTTPKTKEDDLFRSNFARFNLPLMDIEVMGGLEIYKEGSWQPVCINDYRKISIGKTTLRIPTVKEQERLLTLFGRDKDRKRIEILKKYL
jgi:hypothetical protein